MTSVNQRRLSFNETGVFVKRTGTTALAMTPAASIAGFYLAHPEAHYFAVSKIGRDQLEDWAKRTNYAISEAEKWLAPLL